MRNKIRYLKLCPLGWFYTVEFHVIIQIEICRMGNGRPDDFWDVNLGHPYDADYQLYDGTTLCISLTRESLE